MTSKQPVLMTTEGQVQMPSVVDWYDHDIQGFLLCTCCSFNTTLQTLPPSFVSELTLTILANKIHNLISELKRP